MSASCNEREQSVLRVFGVTTGEGQSEENPEQVLNAAFLALVVIPKAPSLPARSDPDWNCDSPSPYRRRA